MMENLTAKERDLIKALSVLAVLVYGGVIYYNFWVVNQTVKKNNELIAKAQEEIKGFQADLQEVAKQKAQLAEIKQKQAQLAKLVSKLPNTDDAPGFYYALQKILQATRVEYTDLRQDTGIPRDCYVEIPYHITCRSRYHDFGQFLNLLEENPDRFMRVKSFTIDNQDQRPSVHPVRVDLATFRFTKGS